MAIIYSYQENEDLLNSDMLVGTATTLHNGKVRKITKNFTLGQLKTFINTGDLILSNGGTSGPATLIDNILNIPVYQGQITLTTTGSSGAATLIGNTLNIPNYTTSTPTLQQVTTAGNTTSNSVIVSNGAGSLVTISNNGIFFNTSTSHGVIFSNSGFSLVDDLTTQQFGLDFDGLYLKTISGGSGGRIKADLLTSTQRTYQLPDASGTFALTSDIPIPTLDYVLAEGNTSLSDAYIGALGVWDNANAGYMPISAVDNSFVFKDSTADKILAMEQGVFSLFKDNIIAANLYSTLLTTARNFDFPDASGTIALTSDIPSAITLTTTGSSGSSTLTAGVLNVPTYTLAGLGGVPTSRTLTINGTAYDLTADRSWSVGTVTSVGLSMPSAFTVASSPITGSGTIAVTGAGTVSQYVRGDGTLANFPNSTGGGASVNYYLNGSISQGTFGGVTYYQMSKTPILGAGTNFTRTNGAGNGYIASFLTDAGDPSFLNIPGGNWNLEFYFQSSASGGSPQFYGEIYKVSATNVFTLIASGSANPEGITNGTTVDQYFTSIPMPQTSLLITDRLAIRIYVITGGRTITLHTENGNLCEVLTTFTTGLTALNGLTSQVQYFAVGTSGTDFNISSATDTHTFNLPTASATNRGALSSTDWTTFNAKQNALLDIASVQDNGIYSTFMNGAICYFLAGIGATTFSNLRINSNFVLAGSSAYWSNNAIQFTSSATAGTFAFQRGVPFYHAGKSLMRFQPNIVSTGARYFVGLSYLYQLSNPTNVEPTTLTQTIGVAKLSTSTNLFIIHNDGTGTATSVDLGVNYPATSNLYIYDIKITSTGSVFTGVTVRRTTISDNTYITYNYSVPGDYPTGVGINPALWITNNATAAANSLYHFGAIGYNNTI